MQAETDFKESINEISILNNKAKEDVTNDKIYYKSIILLLCAKLERYVKASATEYISTLINLKLTRDSVPEAFIAEIIDNEIAVINKTKTKKYISTGLYQERAKIFSIIWDPKYNLDLVDPKEFCVSLTNNGSTEFENTYKKIGFPTIINDLKDYVKKDIYSETSYSVKDYINKVINMRHNIIHDDATPLITQTDITLYKEVFCDFVRQIDTVINDQVEKLRNL